MKKGSPDAVFNRSAFPYTVPMSRPRQTSSISVPRAKIEKFQLEILQYYKIHKRAMAWRDIADPYKIFVSEMMLQQTQVERVKTKFAEFIARFPTVRSVAQADKSDMLKMWQGLGYNRRALFIKHACEEVVEQYGGKFPKDFVKLQKLPGIGPSTAGALCAFAYNQPVFYIETNIRAVILHFFFADQEKVSDKDVMEILKLVTPDEQAVRPRDWYYALYDYGTHLKKILGKKRTALHKRSAHYNKQSKFEGSFRQKRAAVLRLKLADPDISDTVIIEKLNMTEEDLGPVLDSLTKDGMI
jgi:A/G-specific adenine glycosylase